MPRKGITIYDLLISCPGDVTDYLEILKESVATFNRSFGVLNNIEVVTKHWSTDSYPESGDKPQELLNKQFVRNCDAAVSIFWTRFGTETDKYGSGTEEEIEEMLLAGKQVFMYFLDEIINPSKVDTVQYQKVLDFRKKYEDRGVYAVVKDKDDFQRKFTNHLSLYFLKLISEEEQISKKILKPVLTIRDINTSSDEYSSLSRSSLLESNFINEKKEKIIKNIEILKDTILPKKNREKSYLTEEKSNIYNKLQIPKLNEYNILSFGEMINAVKVSDDWIKIINDFAYKNKIKIEEDFWNVGNLKSYKVQIQSLFSNSNFSYEGTDEEKKRYSLLEKLYWEIKGYNEYNEYFGYIDSIEVAKLMISNLGKAYDEDIDIKLIIPKDCFLKHHDLPYPGIDIIEEVLNIGLCKNIFSIKETDTVTNYGYYQKWERNFSKKTSLDTILRKSMKEKYEDRKKDYGALLDILFLYKEFENSESNILKFHIKYLKHNSSMAFPSVLMFKNIPQVIEYEITSKHIPEVIKGKINLKK